MRAGSRTKATHKQAFDELEQLILAAWDKLTVEQRQQIGSFSAARFVYRVRYDLRRVVGEPVGRVQRDSVATQYAKSRFPHLRPGGPAAQREARGLTVSERITGRPFDDRRSALSSGKHSFTLKQLEALREDSKKLRADLQRLQRTPLVVKMRKPRVAADLIPLVSRGLNWYARRYLRDVIKAARQISARERADTRKILVQLMADVETVTGKKLFALLSEILNDRAQPDDAAWTPRLLQRWSAEAKTHQH